MAAPDIPQEFLHHLIRCSILGCIWLAARVTNSRYHYGWKDAVVWPGLCFVVLAGLCWQAVVALWVPEPYLDEVFHIPQAQKYCQGRWLEWDDKITTPPGLYILGVAIHRLMWFVVGDCSAFTLRMTNWLAVIFLPFVVLQCRRLVEARHRAEQDPRASGSVSIYAVHTAVNAALFPLIFFFSGLYYTDVFSTLVVLVAFWNHLERVGPSARGASSSFYQARRSDILVILLGVASLFMRQTNVFWTVVFMGGLEAVHAARSLRPPPTSPGKFDRETMVKFYLWRYSQGEVHDPLLHEAGLEDVFFCALSLAIAVVCNPLRVLKQIWAHIMVMGLFAVFVFWNGSVVLGDKSNHVATLHLAQMLYIWPLFAFFSAPLLLPAALQPILGLFVNNDDVAAGARPSSRRKSNGGIPLSSSSLLTLAGYASLAPLALAIVRYNTIVHPFTLADNRHYMFYVFRYSILRAGWVRYALVPVYVGCGILCWRALGGFSSYSSPPPFSSTRTQQTSSRKKQRAGKDGDRSNSRSSSSNSETENQQHHSLSSSSPPPSAPIHDDLSSTSSTSATPTSLSIALLWLLTTMLSLITAPLVEPRYFILPWLFWRLLAPAWSFSLPGLGLARRYDLRLWLETAWFAAVNVLTMWIFVTRPFYWRAGDGSLADGGRTQRFMW